jgi:hypothetical protein
MGRGDADQEPAGQAEAGQEGDEASTHENLLAAEQ